MVLNCTSSKGVNATDVGKDQGKVITFKASLKDGINNVIDDIEKKRNKLKGETIKESVKIGAILGGVALAGAYIIGVFYGAAAVITGPVAVVVSLAVAILAIGIFAVIGAVAGIIKYSLEPQKKKYNSQIDRLKAMSKKVDRLSDDSCRKAIAKLEEMDNADSGKEKDALAVQAFDVIEKEIIGGGVEADDKAKIMKETWAAYKKKLAEQSQTIIS